MHVNDFFVSFVVIIIAIIYIRGYYNEISYVQSKVDGKKYLVRKLKDNQQAADLMAEVIIDLKKLVNHLIAKYPTNSDVKRLYSNFNPDNISEGSPTTGYTSYSINKGERIVLCLRNNDENETLVNKNVILYVAIHELGHLATKSIGHDKVFWDNFKFLLTEAVNIGIYKKIDYEKSPQPYCGIKITNSII